jgi:hypothetical protein
MHHYEGQLQLRETAAGGRTTALRSGIRPHVNLAGDLHDVQFDLLEQEELQPGARAAVGITFLLPKKAQDRIRLGDSYPVFEGAREIGLVLVARDVWTDPSRVVRVGAEYGATVTHVGWTAATVLLENGWTAALHSRDIGLPAWAEIATALHEGDRLRVRVEEVDANTRSVKLSPQAGPRSAG